MNLEGLISNIVELDSKSILIGQSRKRRILIFSTESDKQIKEINNIELALNKYAVSKISKDYAGIAGEEKLKACIFILSIKNKIICKKFFVNEMNICKNLTTLNNNYFLITGKDSEIEKYSDLALLKFEIESDEIIIKQISNFKRGYCNDVEGIISVNNYIIGLGSSLELRLWEIA